MQITYYTIVVKILADIQLSLTSLTHCPPPPSSSSHCHPQQQQQQLSTIIKLKSSQTIWLIAIMIE
ncbi:hypothetical protein DERF_013089 [Dermatophagoides farinae]|uniref:Uncharacterized protein n=1 Tax=Dermatophagoides farinae TaxID=6954 RepID=A0A922HL14_DERFA|nr:hypothetical protein DERF_013089 [Dermatophagoides farinae]